MATRGRPTKYSKQMLTQAREYLASCEDDYHVVQYGRTGQIMWTVKFPSVAGLAKHLGVTRSTVYKWAGEKLNPDDPNDERLAHPEFSDMLEEILQEQEDRLLNQGLAGNYNPTITKLVLAKHGYRDAADLTSNGQTLKPMVVDSTVAERFKDATPTSTKDSQE